MIYIGIIILFLGIVLILFIQQSHQKVRNRFFELDYELKQLLNLENFIISTSGNYKLKDINSIDLTIHDIKRNQLEWNKLFNQKYVNKSSSYVDTYPKEMRDRHIEYLLQDIESLIKKASVRPKELDYITDFSAMFNNEGLYMPLDLKDFTKIETPFKNSQVLELDKNLLDLSRKSVYLKNVDGINCVTDLSVYINNKEEILRNFNNWVQVTDNLRTINDSENKSDYLFSHKLFTEDLLRALEKIIRKESNPDESLDQIYLKSSINHLSSEGFNSEKLQTIFNKCREYY